MGNKDGSVEGRRGWSSLGDLPRMGRCWRATRGWPTCCSPGWSAHWRRSTIRTRCPSRRASQEGIERRLGAHQSAAQHMAAAGRPAASIGVSRGVDRGRTSNDGAFHGPLRADDGRGGSAQRPGDRPRRRSRFSPGGWRTAGRGAFSPAWAVAGGASKNFVFGPKPNWTGWSKILVLGGTTLEWLSSYHFSRQCRRLPGGRALHGGFTGTHG